MTCHRCGGLMLMERYDDLRDHASQAECRGWRCVNCGSILDAVIAANRRQPGIPALT
jgi:transposase